MIICQQRVLFNPLGLVNSSFILQETIRYMSVSYFIEINSIARN